MSTDRPGVDRGGYQEVPLAGGIANRGAVVRVGRTVRRPVGPNSAAVRHLLAHLQAVGFDEAPRYLGMDEKDREVFAYLPGEVGVPPFRDWFAGEAALVEAARLLRRYHDAVATFDWAKVAGWSGELADPTTPSVLGTLCHNDVCVENVVYRERRAVALLDFDFAAPGRPLWDVAMAARMWAPVTHPECRTAWPDGLDAAGRLGSFARGYGVAAGDAEELVDAVVTTHRVGKAFVRRHVEAGEPAFVEMWRNYGGTRREQLDDDWMEQSRPALVAAVGLALKQEN